MMDLRMRDNLTLPLHDFAGEHGGISFHVSCVVTGQSFCGPLDDS